MSKKQKKVLYRIIISAILTVILNLLPLDGILKLVLFLVPYLIIGHDILRKAWKGIVNRQVFDENFLMAIATVGAFVLAITETNDYNEAIGVMLFYQVGELFQSYAVGKSRRNIAELMDIRPDYANLYVDGVTSKVDPDEVPIGSIIVVNPGEKVPLDGIVIEGSSSVNTSALTGESIPRDVNVDDEIISGCINLQGVLKIQTTKEFMESTVSKILDMVENASSLKSKSENFISKFAKIYTPAVCYSALALAVLPPLFILLTNSGDPQWSSWLYRALTFLVISCPCALVISIPLTFFAGIGGASKAGILIKGSNYLETLSNVKTIVFDKTGTLTKGVFEVTGIHHNPIEDEDLLELAALAESHSSHPISKSLIQAYGKELDLNRVSDIKEVSGHGVIATVDNKKVAIGNDKLMDELNIPYKPCHSYGTIIHIAIDNVYHGHIVISDIVKEESKKTINDLKHMGIKTVMLTGDNKQVGEQTAKDLGIDEVYTNLLPNDKVEKVKALISKQTSKAKLAFVGDGINDAPVLACADIGLAMGALGSDAAIEAADIVLMDDNPYNTIKAMKIAKQCLRIVYQNIIFALGIKFICLALGAVGIANMWAAIFADVGVMILAVLNAIRILFIARKL